MQTHIRGALSQHPDWKGQLGPYQIEGACILSQWSEVARLVDSAGTTSDKHALANLLLAMRTNEPSAFPGALLEARRKFGQALVSTAKPNYRRVYDSILQLQVTADLETIFNCRLDADIAGALVKLGARVAQTLPSFRIREVLLNAQRSAWNGRPRSPETRYAIAAAWIQTSKFARRADHRQTAYSAMLQAFQLQDPLAPLQRAKLLRLDQQLQSALQIATNVYGACVSTGSDPRQAMALSKASLLRASLMEATGRFSRSDVTDAYRKSAKIDETTEKPWYHLGHYFDIARDTGEASGHATVVDAKVINSLLRALRYGTKYFFRTLPRILTIWLDDGENPITVQGIKASPTGPAPNEAEAVSIFRDMNNSIRKAHSWIPVYQWLAVFAQLVCRVTHRNEAVFKVLQEVIGKVIDEYPQQAMWAVVGGYQSKDPERRKRFIDIIRKVKLRAAKREDQNKKQQSSATLSVSVVKSIDQAVSMALELQALCDYPTQPKATSFSMSSDFPKMLGLPCDSLLLPLQSSLVVSLPANYSVGDKHAPFPPDLPCIKGFHETVEIMNSLQKPRKITVTGTDGVSYNFLCKPKDDLRKDARLMDFDSMINKLLQSNSDARRRRLDIRTYAVVTLNEECGLIEWVPNTIGLRHILHKLYMARGIHLYTPEVKNAFEAQKADHRAAPEIFQQQVLPKYRPVFHEWFLATFPEPSAWLSARLRYARTAAVMSMVGHVLG